MSEFAGPAIGLPPRRPGSVRRTTNLDLTRPPSGELEIRGRARDLVTGPDGTTRIAGVGLVHLVIGPDRRVARASGHPADLGELIGTRADVGFRTNVWRHVRAEHDAGSPLHLLLDDVAGGLVITGFGAGRTGRVPARRPIDVCIGWATGADATTRLERDGVPPPPDWTPVASPWDDDPGNLHTLPTTGPSTTRRLRSIDVWRDGDGLVAHVVFRDTFAGRDGTERILHEYSADVTVDAGGAVSRCVATPHVLPHLECPLAAPTAARIVGRPVARLRESVSLDFFGPATCTHLNDLLRGLADLPHLAAALDR